MLFANNSKEAILYEIESQLIPNESLESITRKFRDELQDRLMNSKNSMIPSYLKEQTRDNKITSTINTRESKKNSDILLAIDFGGTSLKFAIFKTYPQYSIQYMDSMTIENKIVDIEFFDNIVETIVLQLNDYFVTQSTKPIRGRRDVSISITFSFPLNNNNEITVMGKNFQLTEEIKGLPIDQVLQRSFNKYSKIHMKNKIRFIVNNNIINDSIAVHLTNKYINKRVGDDISSSSDREEETGRKIKKDKSISLILGTGLNACFEVPYGQLPGFKQKSLLNQCSSLDDTVIINSEMGFLGNGIIKLCDDFDVSSQLKMPMPLENITSGNYLPQILKRVLEYYNVYPELTINFDGEMFCQLVEGGDIKTMISGVDIEFIRQIALIIMERASVYLVAAINAINLFIHREGENLQTRLDVGYVGSFLAYGKIYQEMIERHSNGQINLKFLPDSSLIGAAVIGDRY